MPAPIAPRPPFEANCLEFLASLSNALLSRIVCSAMSRVVELLSGEAPAALGGADGRGG